MTIQLELVGPYPADGYEDEDGTQYFNDTVWCREAGVVETLQCHVDGDELVIDNAPPTVLVSAKPVSEWPEHRRVGASRELSPFGFERILFDARNGAAAYRVLDEGVVWKDRPDEATGLRVAVRDYAHWIPEGPVPSLRKSTTTTKDLKLVDPNNVPGGKL